MAHLDEVDAILTSGGAWKGERDLVFHLLDELSSIIAFGWGQGKPWELV
jgi:molybdopterin biosynthesis enzyme